MLAHINPILGFFEEIKKLNNYPEIISNDTATFGFANINPNWDLIHNGNYDPRLFEGFSNSLRKLIILDEPISLKKIHKNIENKIKKNEYTILNNYFTLIQDYLNKNMNDVTSFYFSPFPNSIIDRTNVHSLLNNYFASTNQHSKPDAQKIIYELNSLTYWNLTEMLRIMMCDLKDMLEKYSNYLERIKIN